MTIRDQFTTDLRLAQRELKQPADSIDSTAAHARHAIKCVCNAAHATIECSPGIFVPRIAMATAYIDSSHVETFDRLERSRQLGCNRDAFNHIGVLEKLPHSSR